MAERGTPRGNGGSNSGSGRGGPRRDGGQGRPAGRGGAGNDRGQGTGRPDRGGKPGERGSKPYGERSGKPGERGSKPYGERSGKPSERSSKPYGERSGKPGERGSKPYGERDGKPGERGARRGPAGAGRGSDRGNDRGRAAYDRRERDERRARDERTVDQKTYDGPPIPDDVTAAELDKHAMRALQGLPDKLADRVARHLVMAGMLADTEPETAYQHALAARARAQRVALVREAVGEVAYAAGKFAEALSEFRAAKRMNGQTYYTPMMADCERALGRPEKAVRMDTPEVRKTLDEAGSVELAIVVAGARRDMGQHEAALRLLEVEPLHSKSRADWVARLRYAYADTLLSLGRTEDAVEWFHRTVAVDGNKQTDAEERLAALSTGTETE